MEQVDFPVVLPEILLSLYAMAALMFRGLHVERRNDAGYHMGNGCGVRGAGGLDRADA